MINNRDRPYIKRLEDIRQFSEKYLNVKLNTFQLEFLREDYKMRRMGKTTAAIVETMWKAYNMPPNSHLYFVTHTRDMSQRALRSTMKILTDANQKYLKYNYVDNILVLENTVTIHFIWINDIKDVVSDMKDSIIKNATSIKFYERRGFSRAREDYIFDLDQMF